MNKYRVIDVENWPRREHFAFYQKFVDPCFNVTVPVEATALYDCARERKESFFLLALYAILRAANAVPQIRQRLMDDRVVEFERLAVMTPIMTDQEMFRQIWCEYAPSFPEFVQDAAPKVEAAKHAEPAPMENHGSDFICASCQPWLHFSAFAQASLSFGEAVPILAWGKIKNGIIPIGCKFHHGFIDGLHVSRFFAAIEKSFAEPGTLWTPEVF